MLKYNPAYKLVNLESDNNIYGNVFARGDKKLDVIRGEWQNWMQYMHAAYRCQCESKGISPLVL